MTPERERNIERVCQAALDRPRGERETYLADACGSDEDLRREVERLLAQESAASAFLATPAVAVAAQSMGATSHGLSAGQRLGAYTILSSLGSGGMGEVYRARDTTLGREVAIKVLPPIFTNDSERLARFAREARVLAALNHPNIATIHGVELVDGHHALVLEVVEGETLEEWIRRGGSLDPPTTAEALTIAKQIAEALEAAHEKGIIHRDLKPANIKIRPDGVVKVLDFGLAKAISAETTGPDSSGSPMLSGSGTGEGRLLGTAAYMSPEQARGKPVDKRADLWAFGCVLYEMLTGRVAFDAETVSDTISAILSREVEWSTLSATTPASVRRLLQRCLEKDPKRRLHDIADARLEIDEAIAEPVAPVAFRDANVRTGARWRLVPVASLLTAILLAGLAALYFRRAAPELAINRFEITTPPTFDSISFALSPDGRQLVLIANAEGQPTLWIRPLDQTQAHPLAGTEGASYPFWAPDSRSIGFFADGKLKRLDLSGGPPVPLADAPDALGGSWSPNGTILFAPFERLRTRKLMRVPAGGGVATEVPVGQGSPRFPAFLPDGRRFLFSLRWTQDQGRNGVYLGELDTPQVRRILTVETVASYAPPGYLLFGRQGVLMAVSFDASSGTVSGEPIPVATPVTAFLGRRGAFSVSANGLLAHRAGVSGRQLTWFDREGKVLGTMGPPDGNPFASPELAPDGRRVAIGRVIQDNGDVWLLDAAADVWTRFTDSASGENIPIWAPDGSRLVFAYSDGPISGQFTRFFEKPSDGSRDERLLFTAPDSNYIRPADWSRDGRVLLYTNRDAKTDDVDLWALPLTGDRTPFPVVQTPFLEDEGQFSPDGRWIAYRSNQSGREEIYLQSFPGPAGRQQLSTGGGSHPRWRRDGKELFYVAPNDMLMVVSIGSAAGQTLEASKPAALFRTRLEARDQPKQQYAVAPDGKRFLMNVLAEENVAPITIVQNWTAGLRR